jgi:predicted enzyme related to lactoylglutathione lyase
VKEIAIITPLNRVIIYVGDVEKCAGFYRHVFGFTTLASDLPTNEWIELETGGCRLAFIQAHGPAGSIHSATGGPMNPHKIVFYAEDVAAVRTQLVGRGAVMGDVRMFGPLALCDGQDPEGHIFQLSNYR